MTKPDTVTITMTREAALLALGLLTAHEYNVRRNDPPGAAALIAKIEAASNPIVAALLSHKRN